jgi:hypothetical protein
MDVWEIETRREPRKDKITRLLHALNVTGLTFADIVYDSSQKLELDHPRYIHMRSRDWYEYGLTLLGMGGSNRMTDYFYRHYKYARSKSVFTGVMDCINFVRRNLNYVRNESCVMTCGEIHTTVIELERLVFSIATGLKIISHQFTQHIKATNLPGFRPWSGLEEHYRSKSSVKCYIGAQCIMKLMGAVVCLSDNEGILDNTRKLCKILATKNSHILTCGSDNYLVRCHGAGMMSGEGCGILGITDTYRRHCIQQVIPVGDLTNIIDEYIEYIEYSG